MSDLSYYLKHQQEVAELEKKIRLLQANNSKWKRKYEALRTTPPLKATRSAKAKVFVENWHNGDKSLTFKQIADKCFLSRETIKNISYKLRNNLC
jgi:hypothetical protein|tara:strand:+ start:3927 stop:4211 length:285 start_codon:yes stop_codon:yes gene_type:complete